MAQPLNGDITGNGMNAGDLAAYLANVRDLTNELQTRYGETRTLVNGLRSYILGNRIVAGKPGLVRSTNFDIATGAIIYLAFAGVLKTIASGTVADTGTSAAIAGTKWGIAQISAAAAGTLTATWATGVAGAGYASEALAIAALPAVPAGEVSLGYVTVQAHASGFTAGTDALQGGTGGNVATTTTYYDATALDPASAVGAAMSALTNSTALTLARA